MDCSSSLLTDFLSMLLVHGVTTVIVLLALWLFIRTRWGRQLLARVIARP